MLQGETTLSGGNPTCERCGETPPFEVLQSAAGYYIGTRCKCGPFSRESGYFRTYGEAFIALDTGKWTPRS